MFTQKTLTLMAALAALATAAGAQTPPPAPAHHGLFGNLLHKRPAMTPGMHPGMGGMRPGMGMHPGMMGSHPGMGGMTGGMTGGMAGMSGGIVGNKNTHVYHMPGDKGAMPSAANRVYFRTEQQAMAAGYRPAGSHGMTGRKTPKTH